MDSNLPQAARARVHHGTAALTASVLLNGASGGTRTPGVECLLTKQVLSPLSHTSIISSVVFHAVRIFCLHIPIRNFTCFRIIFIIRSIEFLLEFNSGFVGIK